MEQIDEVAGAGPEPAGAPGDDGLEVPRRGRTGLVVSAVVAVVALGFVAVLATREPAADREAASPIVGKAAPALAGETLDGGSFDIDDHQGRWVVVNFFATWCTPCRQEHPQLVAFDEAHARTGDAEVVSVLYSDQASTARDYFADNGGEWPVVIDPDGQVALDYGLVKVPETYVVAPNGVVVAKLIGGVTREGLDQVIAEAKGTAPAAGGGGG
ncbi:MAG TPA: TlpA disulfide reductase family protein [Acidimicrobiales bacterium]|nr:TlpA disulfide reductase family protein [Acidimicrobiales bacterium]